MVYLKDVTTAQDIVQSVFIKVWNNRQALAEIDSFSNYIFIITRNIVFDHFKKAASDRKWQSMVRTHHLIPSQVEDATHRLEEHEYDKMLDTAISQLPPRQKEVYRLYHNDGFTYEEIADKLKLSRLTIKKHLELARCSVRNFISMEHFHSVIIFLLSAAAFALL